MAMFEYGHKEIEHLKRRDKKLGEAMEHIGMIRRECSPDPFCAMVSSIVSQQVSKKAAATVWDRLVDCVGPITPENIVMAGPVEIQRCGMSMRKAGYVQEIAKAALSDVVNFETLHQLSDAEIIEKLSSLPGVGIWTAEMLLIFSLGRPDVVSYGDLAIRRGMMNLYGLTALPREVFDRYRKRYSPYGSVASLYLWELSVR